VGKESDEITIDEADENGVVIDSEWTAIDSDARTPHDLRANAWISRLLETDEKVYRVNVCVRGVKIRTLVEVQMTLHGLGFTLLRLDKVEKQTYCFLTSIVRTPDKIQEVLHHFRYLAQDDLEQKNLGVTYSDVTFHAEGWASYP
jgi:hypothetical protein